MKQRFTYFGLLILLTALSYWRVLTFTFWKDDWWLLWSSLYRLSALRDWLHPGTPIEFMTFAPLFGMHPLPWQVLGLVSHVAIAIAVVLFVQALTQSKLAARLSGIFYAASFAGMDAVGWPSAHVTLWAVLFLLIGLYYFTRFVRERLVHFLWISLLYMGIAFIFDPFRVFPVFLIMPLITFIHDKSLVLRFLKAEAVVVVVAGIIVVYVLGYHIYGSQLMTHLTSPMALLSHINVIGNYFNSLANLFTGWLIRFPEDGSTGVYNPFWARFGFFIFCVTAGIGYEYFQRVRKSVGMILLFLVWVFIFYIPDWLFEPRLTMGGTHRYLAISAVGFIALVGYLLSLIRNRTVVMALTMFFILVNIVTANHFFAVAADYRSASRVNAFWGKIDADVPPNLHNLIFVFSGEDPVKTYALSLSGGYPFALRRHIVELAGTPVVTDDHSRIENLLCKENIPLNHLFAWDVKNDGTITNVSLPARREILITVMDHGCVPLIDSVVLEGNR